MIKLQDIEKAIIKRYRATIYRPFIRAIQEYKLINENDQIAVCISGGKDSFLMAKLFQELHKYSKMNFGLKFLVMDPGYSQENINKLKENSESLNIPIIIKKSNIFKVTKRLNEEHPCYLCARMRRGFLYKFAQEQGCNKIALAHHFNDVIETILLNILYTGNYKTMMPKLKSQNYEGMELIRPMIYIKEKDIINYNKYCQITTMNCGCEFVEKSYTSKRKEIKELIVNLKKDFKDVEISIYRSAENVNINCILGWYDKDKKYSFLDIYDEV